MPEPIENAEASEALEAEVLDDSAAYEMDDAELKELLGDDFNLIDLNDFD